MLCPFTKMRGTRGPVSTRHLRFDCGISERFMHRVKLAQRFFYVPRAKGLLFTCVVVLHVESVALSPQELSKMTVSLTVDKPIIAFSGRRLFR